jgi:hypothetical protein
VGAEQRQKEQDREQQRAAVGAAKGGSGRVRMNTIGETETTGNRPDARVVKPEYEGNSGRSETYGSGKLKSRLRDLNPGPPLYESTTPPANRPGNVGDSVDTEAGELHCELQADTADPELAFIASAWSTLPGPIKAAMVTLVKAAEGVQPQPRPEGAQASER